MAKAPFLIWSCAFTTLRPAGFLIDGQDISGVTFRSLRDSIALVTQEPLLFDDTIANNIAYGTHEATSEQIQAAAKAAAAETFIKEFPSQYETPMGEAGNNLSGGEKQRIAIARAILKDAPILCCLDEPTSALDSKSESHFQKALSGLMKGAYCSHDRPSPFNREAS